MENLDPTEERLLQEELANGEKVLWTGRPNRSVVFHTSDWYMIPFSLMWGGFAIFWEAAVTGFAFGDKGAPGWFGLWGIPFVVIGQYMIWGRFFHSAWKKSRIIYALTNERIFAIVRPPRAKVISSYLGSVQGIHKELRSDGIGTLKFGDAQTNGLWNSWFWNRQRTMTPDELYLQSSVPVFVDIDDASEVSRLVDNEIRRTKRTDSST